MKTKTGKYSFVVLCGFVFLLMLFVEMSEAAVYCMSQPSRNKGTLDLYQEIIVAECGNSLYTAQQHGAGYMGLAGHTDVAKHWVNFSIWDNNKGDLNYVVEGPDRRLGGTVERFGNEGTGAKTRLFLRWEFGVAYKTYVKVEHIDGGTLWSGWVGRADSTDWYLCGRIYVPNKIQWVGSGGIFLETL